MSTSYWYDGSPLLFACFLYARAVFLFLAVYIPQPCTIPPAPVRAFFRLNLLKSMPLPCHARWSKVVSCPVLNIFPSLALRKSFSSAILYSKKLPIWYEPDQGNCTPFAAYHLVIFFSFKYKCFSRPIPFVQNSLIFPFKLLVKPILERQQQPYFHHFSNGLALLSPPCYVHTTNKIGCSSLLSLKRIISILKDRRAIHSTVLCNTKKRIKKRSNPI